MAKKYELKEELKACDLFSMIRLLKKIGLDNVSKSMSSSNINELLAEGSNESQIGMAVVLDIAQVVIDRISDCETEVYNLLAQVSNLSIKQVRDLNMDEFVEMVIELVQREDFKKAFTKVVSLFK